MNEDEMRADAALVAQGLASGREKARTLIEAGLVTVNGSTVKKPSTKVRAADALAVHGQICPYVSRGGLKLEKALKVFGAEVSGSVCMDIGASTGGFTDVLLKNGARRVYAIDVGSGQLDQSLLSDNRVVSMEHINARTLDPAMFGELPTLGVMDVSFISIQLILPAALKVLGEGGRMITLIKPQFEVGRENIGKHGIVTKPEAQRMALRRIADFVPSLGWRMQGLDYSPIAGGDGNIEFLADLVPERHCSGFIGQAEIEGVVGKAHEAKL